MKKISIVILLIAILASTGRGREHEQSVPLRFSEDGIFRIVQFTDIHFNYKTPRSDSVLTLLKTVIREEKPDLVVVTGDIVCSANTRLAWLQVTQPFIDAQVPWAITLGNHDHEGELTNDQIIDLVESLPYCVTTKGPANISGSGNYVLHIQSSKSFIKTAALIYCIDSNSYSSDKDISFYDWIKFDQIQWYRQQSIKYTRENDDKPYPSLAFFHIPLPEYKEILNKETTLGDSFEFPTSPDINSGFYNAMVEMKDIMATFVGHDHDDNFIGCLHGICLGYGSKTGLDSYGRFEKGARVIELHEGERRFDTWIRTIDKQPKYVVTYPDFFIGE